MNKWYKWLNEINGGIFSSKNLLFIPYNHLDHLSIYGLRLFSYQMLSHVSGNRSIGECCRPEQPFIPMTTKAS